MKTVDWLAEEDEADVDWMSKDEMSSVTAVDWLLRVGVTSEAVDWMLQEDELSMATAAEWMLEEEKEWAIVKHFGWMPNDAIVDDDDYPEN